MAELIPTETDYERDAFAVIAMLQPLRQIATAERASQIATGIIQQHQRDIRHALGLNETDLLTRNRYAVNN